MKIPKRLKVGAITYRVVQAKDWLDRNDADGMVDAKTNTIYIQSELSPAFKDVTLIHEALHCINSTMNHEFLDSLSEQLYQVFSDNNLLR
jgi:hypothetical protein